MTTNITRTFTTDELEDLDVTAGGKCVRSDEIVDQKRWANVRHIVFEHEGSLWQVTYYEGATESQESGWGYGYEPETVEATQVEPYETTVTKYRPVRDGQPAEPVAHHPI